MTGDQQTIHKENPVGKIMQRSIGAYYRYVHGRLHLFFFYGDKTWTASLGTQGQPLQKKTPVDLSFTRCSFIRFWHFENATFFMTIEDIKHTYLCSIFRPHYVTVITYLPRESDWLVRFTLGRPRWRDFGIKTWETEREKSNRLTSAKGKTHRTKW